MNKRIKKKYRDLQIADICDQFVETIPLQDHTAVFVKVDPVKVQNRLGSFSRQINMLMKRLKRDHDIDLIVTTLDAEIVSTDQPVKVVTAGNKELKGRPFES